MTRPGERKAAHILVVEDAPTVAEVVVRYLQREGYRVEAVGDGLRALERAAVEMPDLVVLDLMLPGADGFEVSRRLRESAPVPVIMLTARGDEADRIVGLELGADDYLAKPFSPRELVARVKAVLRRAQAPPPGVQPAAEPIVAGDIVVDERSRKVTVRGRPVALTVREFELLAYLMRNPGRAFRREELLEAVWGYTFGDTSTVTVHVRRLREKIEVDPAKPTNLQTVWGVGYRFDPDARSVVAEEESA